MLSVCPPITWNDESEEHIAGHNVLPHEVEEVVYTHPRLKKRGRDDTTLFYGQSNAGRYLFIVTDEALDGGMYIVTARDMTNAERREFLKKAR